MLSWFLSDRFENLINRIIDVSPEALLSPRAIPV
jgi:hypothetical protein